MKKILTALFAALLCIGANAQIVSSDSRSLVTKVREPQRSFSYMKLGFNANTVVGTGSTGCSAKPGYDMAFGFGKYFGKSPVYWGMEYGLTSRGFSVGSGSYSSKLAQHGFKFNLFQVGCRPTFGKFSIDPHIGIGLSVWYYGCIKVEDYDAVSQYDEAWPYPQDEMGFTFLSVNMPIGFGFWFDRFNIDYTCEIGMTPFLYPDSECHHVNHMIRLGISF